MTNKNGTQRKTETLKIATHSIACNFRCLVIIDEVQSFHRYNSEQGLCLWAFRW